MTERFALAVFTVLSGALATNMLVLQPPARKSVAGAEDRIAAMRQDSVATGAISVKTPEASGSSSPAAPKSPEPSASPETVIPTEQQPLKVAPPPSNASPELIKAIQRELRAKGYETGAEDGSLTLVTRAAIMAYEADQKMPFTAEANDDLLKHIILGDAGGPQSQASTSSASATVQDVVRQVQAELKRAGYDPGAEDGQLSEATIRAIRSFESAEHMTEKGRISGEVVAKLKSAPAKP